jgi:hypothetical protein
MPKRQQFLDDMRADNRHAVVLLAQVGGMPNEIQVVVQTAEYLPEKSGFRPIRSYIVRVLGATEHHLRNLGITTQQVSFTTEHPVLYQYTARPVAVFFRGQARDVHELALDIAQAHAQTFEGWRHFPDYINVEQPLTTLLKSGGGLLGQMPQPLANRLEKVLQAHGLETNLMVGEAHAPDAKSPLKDQPLTALIIGESYFISYAFSFDEMGKA